MHVLEVKPLGDRAVIVQFGHSISISVHQSVQAFMEAVRQKPFKGLIECVPAYTNVCLHYDPIVIHKAYKESFPYEFIVRYVMGLSEKIQTPTTFASRIVEIPVHYGGVFGPDLAEVAAYHGITEQEVVRRHSEQEVFVYMLGFAPGFAFMGGMDETIAMPRKSVPRMKIEAGSVGIAGKQTGIYPFETPGGWNIIGRTFEPLFRQDQHPPTLLQAGDKVRFVPIEGSYHDVT